MVHPKKILSLILCFAMLTVILPAAYAVPTPAFLGPADLEDYYGLPDPFTFLDGHKVETEDDWAARRAEIFDMIQYYLYGYVHIPTVTQVSRNGTAISYTLSNAPQVAVDPSLAPATVNVSVTFSFNAANGVGNRDKLPVMIGGSNSAGFASSGWPGNTNQAGGTQSYTGTYYTLYPYIQGSLAYDTGKLIAGGWEVGRLIDALLLAANDDDPSNDFPEIDPYGMIPTGFSQGGKRALLAAAIDERVAVGFPGHAGAWGNSSVRLINDAKKYPAGNSTSFSNYTAADGIAAANMFSGYTGLRSEQMNQQHGNSYNTWFTSRFQAWTRGDHRYPISDANPSNLAKFPIDQHFLVALMAPRPVVLTEGMDDYWNDPEGCAIIHAAAKKVYEFFGVPELCNILINPSTQHAAVSNDRATVAALYNFAYRDIAPTFKDKTASQTWSNYNSSGSVPTDFNLNAFTVINPSAITYAKPGQYLLHTNGVYEGKEIHTRGFVEGIDSVIPVTSDAESVVLKDPQGVVVQTVPVENGQAIFKIAASDATAGVYTFETVGGGDDDDLDINILPIECWTWAFAFRPEILKEGNHRYIAFSQKIDSVDVDLTFDTLETWMQTNAASTPYTTGDDFVRFAIYDTANGPDNNYRQNMQYGIRLIHWATASNPVGLSRGGLGYYSQNASGGTVRNAVTFGAPTQVLLSNITFTDIFQDFTFDLTLNASILG